jgi:hypothetical protein
MMGFLILVKKLSKLQGGLSTALSLFSSSEVETLLCSVSAGSRHGQLGFSAADGCARFGGADGLNN